MNVKNNIGFHHALAREYSSQEIIMVPVHTRGAYGLRESLGGIALQQLATGLDLQALREC